MKEKIIASLLFSAILTTGLSQAATLVAPSISDNQWLKPSQSFQFRLIEDDGKTNGRLVFFLDKSDITAVIKQTGIDEYTYRAELFPLPSGKLTFTAYLVTSDNQWITMGELPLQVLSGTGFEESELTPRFDITEKSQFFNKATGDAFATDPETSHDLALSTGLNTRQNRNGWEWRSNWNVVGSSVQEEALRFGELQDDAPKTDLSDYLLEVQKGSGQLSLGHVNFGNNPLLLSSLANRGVVGSYRAFDRFDISITSQSGQTITGYNNFFGIKNFSTNNVQAGSIGYDVVKSEIGQLRAELTYLNAEITSDLNFNIGEVADSEKNKGYGLLLTAQSGSGRLRAALALARSTYQNPEDPFLSQNFDIVPSLESTDNARNAHIDFDLIQPSNDGVSNNSLTLSLNHDRTDALYKSVAAFLSPDVETNTINTVGQLGKISWQIEIKHSRDNLDDLDSVLTTITESNTLNFSVPLQSFSETPKTWLPQIFSYSVQQVHQFGDNLPIDFDPTSQIPDQVNLLQNANFSWQFGNYSVGYTLSWSDQDNRQLARADADFRDINHGINLNLPFTDNFTTTLTLGAVSAIDREQNLKRFNGSGSISIDWRIGEKISLSSNYSVAKGSDSENFSESDSSSLQTQLTYQFKLALSGRKKLPGQFFIRYSFNDNYSIDNQFQFESDGRNRSINGGFNLSLF